MFAFIVVLVFIVSIFIKYNCDNADTDNGTGAGDGNGNENGTRNGYAEGFLNPTTTTRVLATTTTDPKLFDIVYKVTEPVTTIPNMIQSAQTSVINQRGNVIYYANVANNLVHVVKPIVDSPEYGTKDMKNVISISLGVDNQQFIIKQILVSKFNNIDTNCKVRVSVIDTKNNQVQFAGLTYNLVNNGEQMDSTSNNNLETSEVMYNRITQLANSKNGIFLDDIRTIYGTDLVGNKINIFIDAESVNTTSVGEIIITGYADTHKITDAQLQNAPDSPASNFPDGQQTIIKSIKLSVIAGKPPPATTRPANTSSVTTRPANTSSATTRPANTPSAAVIMPANGIKFRLTYTSPYSNNLFTYPGAINGQFIYTDKAPVIHLTKMLLTNQQPKLVLSTPLPANTMLVISDYNYSTQVSQGDVIKFRVENNLTDLRGSINPDYVCPDIQGLINKHLDAETIVDSMEYLDKINTEKVKLSSNKNNLLTLIEQQEDIKKLESMVNKIRELQAKRTQESDALAALQFTKQMNEVMRLRETIEQRIAQRNRNKLDIDINVIDADAAALAGTPDIRDIYNIN